MTSVGVLPRSLAPLPDESLLGFLLRMAHRLDTSPLRLALSDRAAQRPRQPPDPDATAAGDDHRDRDPVRHRNADECR